MYIIYKITNTLNNKVYIGQTKQTLAKRWYGHRLDARTRVETTHKYHFLKALKKYDISVWELSIIVSNVPSWAVNAFEKYWIHYYDSYTNGYNSTIGGEQPPILIGTDNHKYDNNIYTFYNAKYGKHTGTLSYFVSTFGVSRYGLQAVLSNIQKSTAGWTSIEANLEFIRGKANYTCACGNTKVHNAKTCIKCRDTSKEKNGMYGKSRPTYVKEAVSKTMRAKADQTKRTWIHSSGIIQKDVTSLELRDMYNLNISHLKKITDDVPRYKTHKGWKLCGKE